MTFGEDPGGAGCGVEESEKILATYLDRGGNFVDTANFYTNGHSEKILGDFFAAHPGRRERVVLARTAYVGGPTDDEYRVIDAVAAVADELGTTSAAVSLAWLRAREGTVVPIVGARRVEHLEANLAALDTTLQFAGTTVDGEPSTVYPPLLQSDVRY